jgi:hypothetical protein
MASLAGKKRSAPEHPATETPAKELKLSEESDEAGSNVGVPECNSNLEEVVPQGGGGGAGGDGGVEAKNKEEGAVTGVGVATDVKR